MKYNTETHSREANNHLQRCIDKGSIVEIIEKRKSKSVSQNAYLHAILDLAAIYFGLTSKGLKKMMKGTAYLLPEYSWVLESVKFGVEIYRSTSTYNMYEESLFIDHVRNFSQLQDCYLPTANEYKQSQLEYDNEIEIQSRYL